MAGMMQVPFGDTLVTRPEPAMPASSYQTYGWSMPLKTHWVKATCEDVDCASYLKGWVTKLDLSTELGQRQYCYCKHDKTRRFTERRPGASLVELVYGPGNACFQSSEHMLPYRPPRFYVARGDFRGIDRTSARLHQNGADWAEDFAEHQGKLALLIQRG